MSSSSKKHQTKKNFKNQPILKQTTLETKKLIDIWQKEIIYSATSRH